MTRVTDPRFNKVAIAVAVTLTFAAVTAFGVAPLGEAQLPSPETIVESVSLEPEVATASSRPSASAGAKPWPRCSSGWARPTPSS